MSIQEKISNQYDVRFVDAAVLRPLRHSVLRPGFPYETTIFDGDDVPTSVHASAFDKATGDVAGIGTLVVQPWDREPDKFAFRLRGMAVDDKHKGTGVGRIVLDALEQFAREEGAALIWCNARTPAVGFYKRCDWEVVSDEYEIATVGPHYNMIKRLT